MPSLTKQDIVKYLTMIRVNFENSYAGTKEEQALLVETWFAILKPFPKELVGEAVKRALMHSEFAPRIGNIVNEIERMQQAYSKSDGALWAELCGVLPEANRNYRSLNYTYKDEYGISQGERAQTRLEEIYKGLSAEIQEYLGNWRQLCAISEMDGEALGYEKGRFMKAMPSVRARVQIRGAVSPHVRAFLCTEETLKFLPPNGETGA